MNPGVVLFYSGITQEALEYCSQTKLPEDRMPGKQPYEYLLKSILKITRELFGEIVR